MNNYTVNQLTDPETYVDRCLSDFVVALAGSAQQLFPNLNKSEITQQMLTGQHAERVHKSWHKRRDKWLAENAQSAAEQNAAQNALINLETPPDVAVTMKNNEIWLTIPRDGGLMTPKIKRLGGWWDADHFVLPAAAANSLPRILKNWQTAFEQQANAREQAKRSETAAREQARRQREAQWTEEKREKSAQPPAKVRANRDRVKIEVGKYQIGDRVSYYENYGPITSFGKTWSEQQPDASKWRGTRYDEQCDGCRRMGEVENETGLCPKCFPYQVTKKYCYAYFS